MTGNELHKIRQAFGMTQAEFSNLIYGPPREGDVHRAKLVIRQYERDTRPIPPVVARSAALHFWHFEARGSIPAWSE